MIAKTIAAKRRCEVDKEGLKYEQLMLERERELKLKLREDLAAMEERTDREMQDLQVKHQSILAAKEVITLGISAFHSRHSQIHHR